MKQQSNDLIKQDIANYLEQHEKKDMLRFLTCGNVDDGKSTLIGRLLFDSKMIFEDQVNAIKKDSLKFNTTDQEFDLALLVDGLQSEREQGITIDVAYRYFTTDKRKFIIADCPGHEQYTRNMATGASNCDVAIVIVDARKGISTQTKRHSYICSLLGINNIVVAINKMDLVDYDENIFKTIERDYMQLAKSLDITNIEFIPLSALLGDNIVTKSVQMPWYKGKTMMHYLETVNLDKSASSEFILPVQYVNRPNLDFRGFCGTIASGQIKVDDEVIVLPSKKTSKVKSILINNKEQEFSIAGQAITLTLVDEIDISRGDVIAKKDAINDSKESHVIISNEYQADLVWMHENPLHMQHEYIIKLASKSSFANVIDIVHEINVNTLDVTNFDSNHNQISLNGIARVLLTTKQDLAVSNYNDIKATGAFILIDKLSNLTVAAGMIREINASKTVATNEYQQNFDAEFEQLIKKYYPKWQEKDIEQFKKAMTNWDCEL